MNKLILAASTGGHLTQLVRLAPRLGASEESLWITFRNEQSEKLLEGRRVHYVDYIRPRDVRSTWAAYRSIAKQLRCEKFDAAYSTGAALALAALPAARLAGVPSTYIESVSRFNGPSLSGRILAASHMVELRTQHKSWSTKRWIPTNNVLSQYSVAHRPFSSVTPKIFVTLGTIRPYRFDALVDNILSLGLDGANLVWQLGETRREGLPGHVNNYMDSREFEKAVHEADVVVTHAGVGTILNLLDKGKFPIAVPRRQTRGEHIDNHQSQVCDFLVAQGLGLSREAGTIKMDDIIEAAESFVKQVS